MGKGNYQKIGCGVHGGGNGCGCGKPKLSMTPEEINALLDKLEEILNNGGQPSPAPSPIVPAGVELTDNKVLQVRPYVAEGEPEDTAENDKYPSERAVARALYLMDQYVHQVAQDGSELAEKVGSLEYFAERYRLPVEVLPLSSFSVGGIMEALHKMIDNLGKYCAGLDDRLKALEGEQQEDILVSISWNNGSIEPSTINVGGIAVLTKGTVTATYESGRIENVTNLAEFDADRGKIQGNTYIAPDTIGEDTISVSYGGKSASSTIHVNVIEQTYTIKLTVIHGTKSPDSDLIVNAGGSAGWTIEPEDGYQLPIGVVGAELIGNVVNVTNVQADNTYIAECQPIETHLPVYVGAGADYASAVLINTSEPLTNNMGVEITANAGDYLFIKVDKKDTVNNLWIDNGVGEDFIYNIPIESGVIDGDYKYYKSVNRYNASTANYIINKV